MKKFDHIAIGSLLGLFTPAIVLLLFFFFKYDGLTFERFLHMVTMEGTLSPRISLCAIANLLLFYLFIWTHRYHSARGVILSTFLYAGLILYLKLAH